LPKAEALANQIPEESAAYECLKESGRGYHAIETKPSSEAGSVAKTQ